ncbi:hypothetical protein [Nonomuraea candida]|uniref:hypothetical protein n=1 Tax=Nonomuraea candida TaxID=359159 RepID=UPI0005BD4A30|nr:hypothetical protein [Nonomuraea candida]
MATPTKPKRRPRFVAGSAKAAVDSAIYLDERLPFARWLRPHTLGFIALPATGPARPLVRVNPAREHGAYRPQGHPPSARPPGRQAGREP